MSIRKVWFPWFLPELFFCDDDAFPLRLPGMLNAGLKISVK